MTRKQSNYLRMADTVLPVLEKNNAVWSKSKPFSAGDAVARAERATIGSASQGQQLRSDGITEDLEELSDEAIDQAARLGRLAQAYALDKDNNNTLFRQMQVNASELDRMSDSELPALLTDIHQRMVALAAEDDTVGKDYGLTEEALKSLDGAIAAYKAAIGSPRVAISERATHTAAIPAALKKMRQAFAKMDRLVELFAESAPGFVSDYRNARVVVDLGGGGGGGEEKKPA